MLRHPSFFHGVDPGGEEIRIHMTTTSPACPMAGMTIGDIDAVLDVAAPEGYRVPVELIRDPPWSPDRMRPGARRFGW